MTNTRKIVDSMKRTESEKVPDSIKRTASGSIEIISDKKHKEAKAKIPKEISRKMLAYSPDKKNSLSIYDHLDAIDNEKKLQAEYAFSTMMISCSPNVEFSPCFFAGKPSASVQQQFQEEYKSSPIMGM